MPHGSFGAVVNLLLPQSIRVALKGGIAYFDFALTVDKSSNNKLSFGRILGLSRSGFPL
jgi:hypothetical protein